MHNSKQTADCIKQLAKEKHIAVNAMLIACDINKDALYTMQSKGFYPRVEALTKIADYLDCSVDYLLGRTDNPQSHKAKDSTETIEVNVEHNNIRLAAKKTPTRPDIKKKTKTT